MTVEPHEQVTLGQALHDLRCNRLVSLVMKHPWWSGGLYLLALVVVGLLLPDYLIVLLAPPLFAAVAIVSYLVAERRFHAGLRRRQPRCLGCKRLIWQAQCGRCHLPVPQLTLLLGGHFLRHCPHCEASLAERESLRAWCHACGESVANAAAHYRRTSQIEFELSATLPPEPVGRTLQATEHLQELQLTTPRACTFVFRVTNDKATLEGLPQTVMEGVTQVWIDKAGVNSLARHNLLTHISDKKRVTLLLCAEDIPVDINPDDWGQVKTKQERPIR